MDSALHETAAANPNQKFALIDMPSRAENVLGVTFKEEEGSYLAGLLAGLTSKTGRIGFVGGKDIPLIKKFEVGFRAGVMTANPRAIVTAKYTEDWSDIQKGKEAALSLYNTGADIVYHAAGRCGLGVINAAKEKGKLAIGVDSDQDHIEPGYVLTSMVKSVDKAVFDASRMVRDGTFKGRTLELGVKDGYISLSEPKEYTKPLMPDGSLDTIEEARRMIADGALIIPKTPAELARFRVPRLAGLN
jgi:basic membrane protein A